MSALALLALMLLAVRAVDGAPPISLADGAFTFQAQPLPDDPTRVVITLSTLLETGWVAAGLGQGMGQADVWLLSPESTNAAWNISARKSTTWALPELDAGQGVVYLPANSTRTASITRLAAAPADGNLAFENKTQKFIYAVRRAAYTVLAGSVHDSQGVFNYNAFATEIADQPSGLSSNTAILVHASLMATAWSFISFSSVFIARYLKSWLGPAWFQLHRGLFVLVAIMTLTAFGFGVYGAHSGKNHFSGVHGILGLVVVIAMLLQTILGIVIDKTFDANRKRPPLQDKLHWYFGALITLVAAANVILGHFQFKTSVGLTVFNIIVIVAMLTLLVVGQFRIGQTHE